MNEPKQIKIGVEQYNSTGFTSENDLTTAGLLKGDDLTQVMTFLNDWIRDESPFMWLNAGQKGYKTELEGDGQFYWPVMGAIKEHDTIVGSPYSGSDKPGINKTTFLLHLSSNWIKEGWIIKFQNGYQGRVADQPVDKGTYWLYTITPYTMSDTEYCSLDNLRPGNLVREGVYPVPNRFDVGTESNSQTPFKRTNQISKVRFSHNITGNIANKQVATFILPTSVGGDGKTKYWVDYDYWVTMHQNEKKLERALFEDFIYNRDANGRIYLTDRRSGGEPIPTGASVKQQILAEGNYSGYGLDFSIEYWERTVGDITYGSGKSIDFIGYCGTMYMEDFSKAIERVTGNAQYYQAEGDKRITKTSSGMEYSNLKYNQYITRRGDRVTLIHMPYLDAVGQSEQMVHPVSGKPLSSHSCYYIAQGMEADGQPNVQMMCEKGEARVAGIHRGLTNIPKAWGEVDKGIGMIALATQVNEASIHERRSVGVNIRNTSKTFYHFSDINEF